MNYEIIQGDCLQTLKTLPANSVQCCVTSPPYYGLRDYQTATWEGGDAACDHVEKQARNDVSEEELARRAAQFGSGTQAGSKVAPMQFKDLCGKCGARRIDSQVGLEETPELFVAKLVEVFREVRRVLHPTGTVWLNLGDSYAGGGGFSPSAPSNQPEAAKARHAPGAQISGARIKGRGKSNVDGRYRLRADLSPADVAYVLEELAKHWSVAKCN